VRPGTPELIKTLKSSFSIRYFGDLYYAGERIIKDLRLDDVEPSWDGGALIQGTLTCSVTYTDDEGKSLSPTNQDSVLAPFGTRLLLSIEVWDPTSPFRERIQLGWFRIIKVPESRDTMARFGDRVIVISSYVELELADEFHRISKDRQVVETRPIDFASAYNEMRRIARMKLTKSAVPDAKLPIERVYTEDRLKDIYDIALAMGGTPYVTTQNTISVRPINPPAQSSADLVLGPDGTIEDVSNELDSEEVYNGVVYLVESEGQSPLLYELWIRSGPLRAYESNGDESPMGRVPFVVQDDTITTREQAAARAPAELARVSSPRAKEVNVTCIINPLLEVGDVVRVERRTQWIRGRIRKMNFSDSSYMHLTLEVLAVAEKGNT
jgi:hypothetical protein